MRQLCLKWWHHHLTRNADAIGSRMESIFNSVETVHVDMLTSTSPLTVDVKAVDINSIMLPFKPVSKFETTQNE